ncbi:hypothetical protein VNO77_02965 [Canavalia gladiata]|uniref:Uncharacterized protein n=1 Tax=Canavalia gladiata TaxID=3824 RepID=A0AAN9MUP5_CANGL
MGVAILFDQEWRSWSRKELEDLGAWCRRRHGYSAPFDSFVDLDILVESRRCNNFESPMGRTTSSNGYNQFEHEANRGRVVEYSGGSVVEHSLANCTWIHNVYAWDLIVPWMKYRQKQGPLLNLRSLKLGADCGIF